MPSFILQMFWLFSCLSWIWIATVVLSYANQPWEPKVRRFYPATQKNRANTLYCSSPLRHGHVEVPELSESARDGPTRIFGKDRHLELDVVSDHAELGNRQSDLRREIHTYSFLNLEWKITDNSYLFHRFWGKKGFECVSTRTLFSRKNDEICGFKCEAFPL